MANLSKTPTVVKRDVYQIVTDKIITLLESGTIPWKKPWRGGAAAMPKNAVSKKPYRGVNVWLLTMTADAMGYNSAYWLTYKQAKDLGGNVRKGEKSSLVVFWKFLDIQKIDKETGEKYTDQVPFLRYYNVFNADQCDDVKVPVEETTTEPDLVFEPIQACENIVEHMPNRPEIVHDNVSRAYYRPSADLVHMPNKEKFTGIEEYYSTLFHELTHSTSHETRLNRKDNTRIAAFGDADYSKEELVAEMGAAYLCGMSDIETAIIENTVAYIQNWLKALRNDKKLVVHAAGQAQKAADYILGE